MSNQFNINYAQKNLTFLEFISQDNIPKLDKSKLATKWWHAITSSIPNLSPKDKETIELVSYYFELISMYDAYMNMYNPYNPLSENSDGTNFIRKEAQKINDYLAKKDNPRSKVVGKVYNYSTGFMEYQLEDGNFVKILDNKVDGPMKTYDASDYFPDEFLKIVNPAKLRDRKIGEILEK